MKDLEYLQRAVFRKFPRDAKGVLKVSQATRDRVQAWIDANNLAMQETIAESDVFAFLNERLDFEEFRSLHQITKGLSEVEAIKIRGRLTNFVDRGLIEKIGTERRYQYRLVQLLVRQRKPSKIPASALDKLKAKEVAARYS